MSQLIYVSTFDAFIIVVLSLKVFLCCTKKNYNKKTSKQLWYEQFKGEYSPPPPINNQVRLNIYHKTLGVARIRVEISLNQI